VTVADVISYFAGGRTVMVQRDGYEEPVVVPACPAAAVEAAMSDAIRQRVLWLVNGPASFQGEPVPAGVLTATARLFRPMSPLPIDRLVQDAVPDAWKQETTTALALSIGLSSQIGQPVPWTVLRRAIDDAIRSRWLELAPSSSGWPCDMASAATLILKRPAGGMEEREPGEYKPKPRGVYESSAVIEPSSLQDLVDVLPEIIKAAAGVPLQFRMSISLGDGQELAPETVEQVNGLLGDVNPDLRVRS
jgi:hypothetical protein